MLPPSYRNFLAFSNGWNGALTYAIDKRWSVDDVTWLRVRNQEWIDGRQFASSLEVSDRGDASIIVLNPEVMNAQGEWKVWFVGT